MTTRFFFPALFLMSRLSFLHKFILISALFIMPLVGFVYLLSSQMALDSQVASKEMDGDRYLAPLRAALSHAIEEKIAAHAHYVHGAAPDEMLRWQTSIDGDVQQLEAVDQQVGPQADVSDRIKVLKGHWQDLRSGGRGEDLGTLTDRSRTEFIGEITALIVLVGNSSGLILGPQIDSYYLMYNSVVVLPQTQALLGELSFTGDNVVRFRHIRPTDRANVPIIAGQVRANLESLKRGIGIAYNKNTTGNIPPLLKTRLDAF